MLDELPHGVRVSCWPDAAGVGRHAVQRGVKVHVRAAVRQELADGAAHGLIVHLCRWVGLGHGSSSVGLRRVGAPCGDAAGRRSTPSSIGADRWRRRRAASRAPTVPASRFAASPTPTRPRRGHGYDVRVPIFAAPAFLWGLLALPLVVLLHRIRVRRERREVAGSFLWRRARDAGARRPRMRPSILLLLQLLAVTGLSLAAAGPRWNLAGPPLRVLVIEASASMAARDGQTVPAAAELNDVAPGASRLDVARALAGRLARDDGPVAIVRGGAEPRLTLPPSTELSAVLDALDRLQAIDAATDPERTLRIARDVATAGGGAGAEIHWLSDRPPPSTAGVRVHVLAGTGPNVGVTGFELVAGQAWVQVSSAFAAPLELPVEVRRGDQVAASTTLLVPARGEAAATFPVGEGPTSLQARIVPPAADVLALDDVAWAGSPRTFVAMDRGFAALERALGAIDGVQVRVTSAAVGQDADLRVLHGRLAQPPAAGPTVLLPDRDASAVAATILDWDRADPLLRFVDVREVASSPAADPVVSDAIGGEAVPLLQRRDRPEGPVWRFAFHSVRGDLTLRPAFPTLVVNLVDSVRSEDRIALGTELPAGASRDGAEVTVADAPGLYRAGGRTVHASLLDADATRLPGPAAFERGATEPADEAMAVPSEASMRREIAPWLLGLVVVLLLLEWWGWTGASRPWIPRGVGADGQGGRAAR